MESSLDTARRILGHHAAPALPYTDLHGLVSSETTGPPPDAADLLRRIRARPDLFRILDPRKGPWRAVAESHGFPGLEPWILLADGEGGEDVREGREVRTAGTRHDSGDPSFQHSWPGGPIPLLRETVLGLGRHLDDRSATTLSRWMLIAREERTLRQRIPALRR